MSGGQQSSIAADISEWVVIVADIASSAGLGNIDADPAIGSIATDRAVRDAKRMRMRCIIVSPSYIEPEAPTVKSQNNDDRAVVFDGDQGRINST